MPEPIDQRERDLLKDDLERSFFVRAGAGTGKTTILIQRILSLIGHGTPLPGIVAITFTKKAAAELKDRLRTQLSERIRSDGEEVWKQALTDLDAAPIQTIHSFAQSLLTRFPIEAGLPPEISAMDGVEQEIALKDWWRTTSSRLLTDESLSEAWTICFEAGMKLGDFEAIARAMHGDWRTAESGRIDWTFGESKLDRLRESAEELRNAAEYAPGQDKVAVKSLATFSEGLIELLFDASDWRSFAHSIEEKRLKTTFTGTKKEHWSVPYPEIKDKAKETEKDLEQFQKMACCEEAAILAKAIRRAVVDYADERRRNGVLGYDDLLILAERLLRTNTTVLEEVRKSFTHLFIDEFQDTDPLQVEIAALVAGQLGPDVGWEEQLMGAPAGKLLLVGDAKQSIYGFRKADVSLFQRIAGLFPKDQVLRLSSNFRAAGPTIDWVNATFAKVMERGEEDDPNAIDYEPIACGNPNIQIPGPEVQIFGGEVKTQGDLPGAISEAESTKSPGAPGVRRAECWWTASSIAETVRNGTEVCVRAERRPCKFSDIAVLYPSRTSLTQLRRELEALNVPFRLESQSEVFGTQEFRDLRLILRCLDDPTDEVALVGVLKGPAFSLSDADLAIYARLVGRGAWSLPRPEADGIVADALKEIDGLREEIAGLDVGSAVAKVLCHLELLPTYGAAKRPRDLWNRLRVLQSMARSQATTHDMGLSDFVEFLEEQAGGEARVAESIGAEPDDDAVRLLTIHGAKGLEFPMVYIVGLGSRKPNPPGARGVWSSGLFHFKCSAFLSPEAAPVLSANDAQRKEEDKRLLYVAATRTMGHLRVGLFRISGDTRAKMLADALSDEDVQMEEPAEVRFEAEELGQLNADQAATVRSGRAELLEVWNQPVATSPTSISKQMLDAGPRGTEGDYPEQPFVWADRKAKAATAAGTAVHGILQRYQLGSDVAQLIQTACEEEGVQDVAEVRRMVEAALGIPELKQAFEGRVDAWREMFVSAKVAGVLLEGYIDLLVRKPDGSICIIDYKTDRVETQAQRDRSMRHHRVQGACYALMLEKTLGVRPQSATFWFLRADPPFKQDVEDLDQAVAEVLAFLNTADV